MTSVLIKAGHLFDGQNDTTLADGFVGVQGATITSVGRQAELGSSGQENFSEVIDLGPDACLLPGLINMHTHMSFSGGTTVFKDATSDTDPVKMLRIADNRPKVLKRCLEQCVAEDAGQH